MCNLPKKGKKSLWMEAYPSIALLRLTATNSFPGIWSKANKVFLPGLTENIQADGTMQHHTAGSHWL